MKKIFTTLALAGACAFGANAQKNIDLQIKSLQPLNGENYSNRAIGDTFQIVLEVYNAGPDDMGITDTAYIRFYNILEDASGNSYYVTGTMDSMVFASGQRDTLVYNFVQGESWGTTSSGETVKTVFPANSADTFQFWIYGRDTSGALFTDPDITVDTSGATLGGNNIETVGFTWGEPTSIFNPGLEKSSISIYPNPTSNNINFEYNFDKATPATVRVLDLLGRTVMTKDFGQQSAGNNKFTLNVAQLPNGLYTMELVTDDKRAISKFNVNK